jgi:hypothetical protein
LPERTLQFRFLGGSLMLIGDAADFVLENPIFHRKHFDYYARPFAPSNPPPSGIIPDDLAQLETACRHRSAAQPEIVPHCCAPVGGRPSPPRLRGASCAGSLEFLWLMSRTCYASLMQYLSIAPRLHPPRCLLAACDCFDHRAKDELRKLAEEFTTKADELEDQCYPVQRSKPVPNGNFDL